MRFMVYATRLGAENRSRAEAVRRGAGSPSHVTQFWWEVIEGADGTFALAIKYPADEIGLSSSDKGRLVDTYLKKFLQQSR